MNEFKKVKGLISLKEYAASKLESARGRYVCPFCGSGGHDSPTSDSAFSIYGDTQQFHCFACGAHGDIFDLVAEVESIHPSNKLGQLNAAREWLGEAPVLQPAGKGVPAYPPQTASAQGTIEGRKRAATYIKSAQGNVARCADYLQARGLSMDFAIESRLGFDPEHRRLVVPYPGYGYYYVARSIDPAAKMRYLKPKVSEVGSEPIFNGQALGKAYVIATEGQIDCLSVMQLGFSSISVGGAANWHKVVKAIGSQAAKPAVLILFDRDQAGISASRRFSNALKGTGAPTAILEPPRSLQGKDPNEWLVSNKEAFAEFLSAETAKLEAAQ